MLELDPPKWRRKAEIGRCGRQETRSIYDVGKDLDFSSVDYRVSHQIDGDSGKRRNQ